ncbi:hypothetical protein EYR38_010477 [Pleurotus pulmonarius]|nr:hypothetical protein EYR38_010477 [Pleurotus pulmonarius]
MKYSFFTALLCIGFGFVNGQSGSPNNVVITNDDGWATAQIRAQFEALEVAGFNLVLSCPAINRSGTGSSTAPPTTLTAPCEFNTCATGSPPEGSDPGDLRFGIQTLSPQFFGGLPDFVVSGPNVGTNLGPNINGSGTVGAACEAALEGIPSAAFSASTASQISFTTLDTDPNSALSISARIYADLTTTFTTTLLAAGRPILPPGISHKVILTNDDGWAEAQIRAEYEALNEAGFDVILSAPAENRSGTGSQSEDPTPRTDPCEFDSCPAGSPAVGFNETDPRLNYVNAFPVDSVRFGVQTLATKFFNGKPDIVISGSNVGNNLNLGVLGSGTVGAAAEGSKEGIPSIAFSGATASHISYTSLESDPSSQDSIAARIYSSLIVTFVNKLLDGPGDILPSHTFLNVNFAPTDNCPTADSFKFIFTRLIPNPFVKDVNTCGKDHLPDETTTVGRGCFASVTALDDRLKLDVGKENQAQVLARLDGLVSCL